MKNISSLTLRGVVLLALFVIGLFGQVLAQKSRPVDLLSRLKLIEAIELSDLEKLWKYGFSKDNEAWMLIKNKNSGEFEYSIGNYTTFFSPCKESDVGDWKDSILVTIRTRLVIFCSDNSIEVWEIEKTTLLAKFEVSKNEDTELMVNMRLSPDGKRIVHHISGNNAAFLRNAETGQIIAELFPSNRLLLIPVFSPDSKKVAIAHKLFVPDLLDWYTPNSTLVSIFNAETGSLISQLRDPKVRFKNEVVSHSKWVSAILFSNDSKTIFTGSDRKTKSWDVATGKLLHTFGKHKGSVEALGVSPDNKILATGTINKDNRVRLWNIKTGELLLKTKKNGADIWRVKFSPDGKKFLSMTENRIFILAIWNFQTLIWDTTSGKLLEKMKKFVDMSPNWKFVLIFNRKKNTLNLYEYQGNK